VSATPATPPAAAVKPATTDPDQLAFLR
jgi:hypothetical protein